MISKQVTKSRKEQLDEFVLAMMQKMDEAIQKDPTRSLTPWNDYSRKYLRSRLLGELNEWKYTVQKYDGFLYGDVFREEDFRTVDRSDITFILAEMLELLDVANFCFFQYTKLANTLKELDK